MAIEFCVGRGWGFENLGCSLTFDRWFALVRIWSPWLAPRQGKSRFGLDKEAIMVSFLSQEGKHLVMLAISGVDDVMTLFTSDKDGNVVLRVGWRVSFRSLY